MSKIYGIPTVTPLSPGKIDGTGADGKSAYELAVAEGFEGTLQEWLESLKGEPGPKGPALIKGVDYFTDADVEEIAEKAAENVTPEKIGARPNTWTPTASDVGAPTMEYAKKVGAPHNLLDNSDFRNPVNQRGYVSGTTLNSWMYFLDRWRTVNDDGSVTINSNGITTNIPIQQPLTGLDYLVGKKATIAIGKADGTVICKSFTLAKASSWSQLTAVGDSDTTIEFCTQSADIWAFNIICGANAVWAALYEGEYTAETLPEYQPKGYAAELMECRRYYFGNADINAATSFVGYAHSKTEVRFTIPHSVAMRAIPTVTFENIASTRVHCTDGTQLTPTEITEVKLTAIGVTFNMAISHTSIPAGAVVLKVNSRFSVSADL